MNRFVEFINTGNEALAREVISPDAVFHAPSHPEPLRGPDGYMEVIGLMRSAFPDVQWTLEETVTEGDTVAARFTMRGTHDGEFFGIPASGNTISVQAINVYYLADRDPAVRYMWYRNIQAIPGALDEARAALRSSDPPALVVVENLPAGIDRSGETGRILQDHYHRVALVSGVPIYAPRR
jgi:steroid delta-isomerase-like uncharacterized protein